MYDRKVNIFGSEAVRRDTSNLLLNFLYLQFLKVFIRRIPPIDISAVGSPACLSTGNGSRFYSDFHELRHAKPLLQYVLG
jgi:hypothetical protein